MESRCHQKGRSLTLARLVVQRLHSPQPRTILDLDSSEPEQENTPRRMNFGECKVQAGKSKGNWTKGWASSSPDDLGCF